MCLCVCTRCSFQSDTAPILLINRLFATHFGSLLHGVLNVNAIDGGGGGNESTIKGKEKKTVE